jgi:hypothetical protein
MTPEGPASSLGARRRRWLVRDVLLPVRRPPLDDDVDARIDFLLIADHRHCGRDESIDDRSGGADRPRPGVHGDEDDEGED